MLKIETKADLQRLIDDEIQESLTLDYKASGALGRDSKARDELCKDVSAFANSAGGQIVYGIEEKDRKPIRIDSGSELSREWIEQVIDSNVQQRIEGLVITPIVLSETRNAYIITIPQASSRAPHQAPDNKYYKRQNFQSTPMADYEIRDILRRETSPKPYISFSFGEDKRKTGSFTGRDQKGQSTFRLHSWLGNRSRQPAFYSVVTIYISSTVEVISLGSMRPNWGEDSYWGDQFGNNFRAVTKRFSIPSDFPIFEEAEIVVAEPPLTIGVDQPTSIQGSIPIGYEIKTPGFSIQEFGLVRCKHGRLSIDFPTIIS
jgi:hypothetical protein